MCEIKIGIGNSFEEWKQLEWRLTSLTVDFSYGLIKTVFKSRFIFWTKTKANIILLFLRAWPKSGFSIPFMCAIKTKIILDCI